MRTVKIDKNDFLFLSKNIISEGGLFSCQVRGSSMNPFIRDGDIAMIEPVRIETLSFGDVILFESDQRLYMHRIIRKKTSRSGILFYTRGDAAPGNFEKIFSGQIIGQVRTIKRNGTEVPVSTPRQKVIIFLWHFILPVRKMRNRLYRVLRAVIFRIRMFAKKIVAARVG